MTLEEKIGQMKQSGASMVGAFGVSFSEMLNMMFDGKITHEELQNAMKDGKRDYHEEDIRAGRLGSMNGVRGAEVTNRLQKIAVEESRLGIPLIFGSDIIHGYRTVFPTPLAQSCSWDPELARQCAQLYFRDLVASKARPVKELGAFGRHELDPGERKEVTLTLSTKELGFWLGGKYLLEPGAFRLLAGDSSETALETDVVLTNENF